MSNEAEQAEQFEMMCDCPEIQDSWIPRAGDIVKSDYFGTGVIFEKPSRWSWLTLLLSSQFEVGYYVCSSHYERFFKLDTHNHKWQPRQEDFQKMVGCVGGNHVDIMKQFMEAEYYYTLKLKWLAFVMKENSNKIWSGERWVVAPQ